MRSLFFSFVAATLIAPGVPAAELARYRVTVDPALTTATVDVSTSAEVTSLTGFSPSAADRLQAGPLKGAALVEGELRFPAAAKGAAHRLRYSADLRPQLTHRTMINTLTDVPLTLTDPRHWLWLPAGFERDATVWIEFVLPPKVGVASPWPRGRDGAFLLRPQMLDEQGLVAFGTLAQREIELGGATLRLSVASADASEVERFGGWAEGVWRSTRGAVAAPPGALEQLLIVPVRVTRETVPWGEVRRGTGNSVLALVQRAPDPTELREDWTLYHELSHLYLPYLGDDRWLSEGFASYYQNVLRARAGVVTPEIAWQRLAEGLARGARDAKADQTVGEGGRMVTYWTGAALALEWDLALRKASGGKDSLDALLSRFAAKDLPAREAWNASGVAAALDRVAPSALGKDYFSTTLRRTLVQRGFPDYLASFALAGINPQSGSAKPDAPAALLAIMQSARR